MKTCEFDDIELDVLNHAVKLLRRDIRFDLETASHNANLDLCRDCVETLSTIEFILSKIKI